MPETISNNNYCLKSEHLHIIFFTNYDLCSFSFSVFFVCLLSCGLKNLLLILMVMFKSNQIVRTDEGQLRPKNIFNKMCK